MLFDIFFEANFFINIMLNFVTEPVMESSEEDKDREKMSISERYLKGFQFKLDLISVIPIVMII